MVKPSDHSATLQKERLFFSCPLKEKSQSRSICPRKGASTCHEKKAKGYTSSVDQDPSLQLSVNSLKGKIKEKIIFLCISYCKPLSMQMCFFSGGWQVLAPTIK